jgi:hypothetical protein
VKAKLAWRAGVLANVGEVCAVLGGKYLKVRWCHFDLMGGVLVSHPSTACKPNAPAQEFSREKSRKKLAIISIAAPAIFY